MYKRSNKTSLVGIGRGEAAGHEEGERNSERDLGGAAEQNLSGRDGERGQERQGGWSVGGRQIKGRQGGRHDE